MVEMVSLFSQIAAEILNGKMTGKKNNALELFSFERI